MHNITTLGSPTCSSSLHLASPRSLCACVSASSLVKPAWPNDTAAVEGRYNPPLRNFECNFDRFRNKHGCRAALQASFLPSDQGARRSRSLSIRRHLTREDRTRWIEENFQNVGSFDRADSDAKCTHHCAIDNAEKFRPEDPFQDSSSSPQSPPHPISVR